MRMAAGRGLIDDVEAWFGYRKMRHITAHTEDQLPRFASRHA
jgi:hypothetical protein